ncbi:MAG: hypothetical protein ABGF52_12455 [Candidatus Asgardarchaeum sp.]
MLKTKKISKLKITYEIDGEIIKIINKDITEKEKWYWIGKSIWHVGGDFNEPN